MAWLLAIPVAMYVSYEITEWYDRTTKPVYDYFKKEDKDSVERCWEEMRQDQSQRKRSTAVRNNEIRKKYDLVEKHGLIVKNDTEDVCFIIYVNDHFATNDNDALLWAQKVMDMDYFDGDLLNKRNTRKDSLGVDNSKDLLKYELEEYRVVLCCKIKENVNEYGYKIIKKECAGTLSIRELFTRSREITHGVSTQCSFLR